MIELKGPSTAEIKKFIKDKNLVEFNLINDKTLTGQVLWHDEYAYHIQTEDGRVISILKNGVIYYSKVR